MVAGLCHICGRAVIPAKQEIKADRLIDTIGVELEMRPLVSRILDSACDLLGANHGVVGLRDELENVMEVVATRGLPKGAQGLRVPPGVGIGGQILLAPMPRIFARYGDIPGGFFPELNDHAIAAAPIAWRDSLVGFVAVGSAPPRRFTAAELETLATLGRFAAVAVRNARRFELQQRRSERLGLIARVSRISTTGLAIDEVLQKAADAVHEILGYPAVNMPIIDPERPEVMVIRAFGGAYRSLTEHGREQRVSEGIAGAAARTGMVQLVNDVTIDPRYIPLPGVSGIRTELAVPIVQGTEVLGVLNVESTEKFTEEDAGTLTVVADHLAIAIRNARLYTASQRRAERLATIARVGQIITAGLGLDELLFRAADAIHQLLGYPNVDIPLVDPEDPGYLIIKARGGHYKAAITHVDRLSIETGIMGAAVRERRVQLVNDIAGDTRYVAPPAVKPPKAELAVPIVLGDDVLGVVNVEGDGPFDNEDEMSLKIIADHLAVSIRNARLFEGAQALAVLEERQRLARDLHDSVTQLLFGATLIAQSLGRAFQRDPAEGQRQIDRLLELSREAHAEMRTLLFQLRPAEPLPQLLGQDPALAAAGQVLRDGLPATLRRYMAQIAGTSLWIDVDDDGYRPPSHERALALFRVAQEALSNVVKHGRASTVSVRLETKDNDVTLTIRDDGVGFDRRKVAERANQGPRPEGGFGLFSMQERVQALGGTLSIRSRPGAGTTLRASVPFEPS